MTYYILFILETVPTSKTYTKHFIVLTGVVSLFFSLSFTHQDVRMCWKALKEQRNQSSDITKIPSVLQAGWI